MKILSVDVVEQWPNSPGWLGEVTQLSPGPLGHVVRLIDLGAVRLEWNCLSARAMIRDHYTSDWTMFAIQRRGAAPTRHRAQDLDRDDAIVFSPEGDPEHEYVAAGSVASLWIMVSSEAAEQRGWSDRLPQTLRSGRNGISHLEAACSSVTLGTLRMTLHRTHAVAIVLAALEETFGHSLLEPEEAGSVLPDSIAVEKGVRRLVAQSEEGVPLDVDRMSNELGVSRRSLYRSLRQWPGAAPAEFVKTLRLHAVRRKLLAAPARPGEVALIATELGFAHMGRFSGDYRKLFGELPSQTLRRRHSKYAALFRQLELCLASGWLLWKWLAPEYGHTGSGAVETDLAFFTFGLIAMLA